MSLEGLNSLIQLESTRLEGARQVTQQAQQINSTVQQQGQAVSASKMNLFLQKIDAKYQKECAEAEVRKLERILARQRMAESMALLTAGVATALNFAGAAADGIRDAFGAQKLGDISKSLQSPPLNPDATRTTINQPSGTTGSTVFISGPNENGTETVYSFKSAGNGTAATNGTTSDFKAATVSNKDKAQIGGEEYEQMKAKNGGRDLSFAEIQEQNPQLAEKIMTDKCHGMATGEVDNFLKVAEKSPLLFDAKERITEGLAKTGKYDDSSFGDKAGKAVKGVMNVLVTTFDGSVGYFQAYLSMKEKADKTWEALIAARDKLAAAERKLKSLELMIDGFSKAAV